MTLSKIYGLDNATHRHTFSVASVSPHKLFQPDITTQARSRTAKLAPNLGIYFIWKSQVGTPSHLRANARFGLLNLYCKLTFHKTYKSLKDMKLQHTSNKYWFCSRLTRSPLPGALAQSHLAARHLCLSLVCLKHCIHFYVCQ